MTDESGGILGANAVFLDDENCFKVNSIPLPPTNDDFTQLIILICVGAVSVIMVGIIIGIFCYLNSDTRSAKKARGTALRNYEQAGNLFDSEQFNMFIDSGCQSEVALRKYGANRQDIVEQ